MMKKFTGATQRWAAKFFMVLFGTVVLTACESPSPEGPISTASVIVVSEGNYMAGNAEITAYDVINRVTVNNVFSANNAGSAMGDSPAEVIYYNGRIYITLSGSGRIYILDPQTFTVVGKISGLDSPRYMAFGFNNEAYVTNLNKAQIDVINLANNTIERSIPLDNPVERVYIDSQGILYANEWSYGKRLVKINPAGVQDAGTTKYIIASVEVGIQPREFFADMNGELWVLCDGGGWAGNPIGYEAPSIVRVSTNFTAVARHTLPHGSARMIMGAGQNKIYYFTEGSKLYTMNITDTDLPSTPIFSSASASYYGLAQDPYSRELYISDVVDYVQPSTIYRLSEDGEAIHSFTAGVNSSLFLFM